MRLTVALRALRPGFWLVCLGLWACSSQPWSVDSTCSGLQRVEGQFLLQAQDDDQAQQQLMVVVSQQQGTLHFAGFNTVGAKLFTGRVVAGDVISERAKLYRGIDPAALVWGLLVHQLGADNFRCWQGGDYRIMDTAGDMHIWRGKDLLYTQRNAASFTLPERDITIQVQRLD